MGLLLYYYNNITCLSVWMLVRLTMENVLLSMWGTLINLAFENFLFFYDFLSIAIFALVLLRDLLS